MDVVNVIIRYISELRTSSTRIKDIVCEKYIVIMKQMEYDHKLERAVLSDDIWSFTDRPKVTPRELIHRIMEIKKTSPLDSKFYYNIYKIMTMEIEGSENFMVINTNVNKDSKTTKLQQLLDAQKQETLTSLLSLIGAIHNMDNADDFDRVIDQANYYVMFDKQNKQLKEFIREEDQDRFKGVAGLLNDTFYDIINKEKIVTMKRWYDSCRSRLPAIKVLVKLYDEIESGRFNNMTELSKDKYKIITNVEMCLGISLD